MDRIALFRNVLPVVTSLKDMATNRDATAPAVVFAITLQACVNASLGTTGHGVNTRRSWVSLKVLSKT